MTRAGPRRRGARRGRTLSVGGFARYDLERRARTGVPEVVLAEGKVPDHLMEILRGLRAFRRGAFISRPTTAQLRRLRREADLAPHVESLARDRLLRLEGPLGPAAPPGTVAILTAGTADVPIAEESVALLRGVGVIVVTAYDVGVAGLHRLTAALRRVERRRPSVYLVFAGREGALPTVVAGLVRAPVVGVPTSVGYGRGGRGEAALLAMLQSCAPVAVVNVDAAVPAALFALHLLGGAARRAEKLFDGRRR